MVWERVWIVTAIKASFHVHNGTSILARQTENLNLLSVFLLITQSHPFSPTLLSSFFSCFITLSCSCCHSHAWVRAASHFQQSSSRHTVSPQTQTPESETPSLLLSGPHLFCFSSAQDQSAVDLQTPLHSSPRDKDRPGPSSEESHTEVSYSSESFCVQMSSCGTLVENKAESHSVIAHPSRYVVILKNDISDWTPLNCDSHRV